MKHRVLPRREKSAGLLKTVDVDTSQETTASPWAHAGGGLRQVPRERRWTRAQFTNLIAPRLAPAADERLPRPYQVEVAGVGCSSPIVGMRSTPAQLRTSS